MSKYTVEVLWHCREESLWNDPNVEGWSINHQKSSLCKYRQDSYDVLMGSEDVSRRKIYLVMKFLLKNCCCFLAINLRL